MIIALDIETIPNVDMIDKLPEPSIDSRLKDPAKITAAKIEARQKQIGSMALDAFTARVCCYAAVGLVAPTHEGEQTHGEIIEAATDDKERELLQSLLRMLGSFDIRIITWNGIQFDLPMIYKRAMILGIDPGNMGAPALSAWTKRYNTERHYDLMQIWGGWSSQGWAKLETVAAMILGETRADIPYEQVPELIKTDEGRKAVLGGCINHTTLTWRLWKRFNGCLFQ